MFWGDFFQEKDKFFCIICVYNIQLKGDFQIFWKEYVLLSCFKHSYTVLWIMPVSYDIYFSQILKKNAKQEY